MGRLDVEPGSCASPALVLSLYVPAVASCAASSQCMHCKPPRARARASRLQRRARSTRKTADCDIVLGKSVARMCRRQGTAGKRVLAQQRRPASRAERLPPRPSQPPVGDLCSSVHSALSARCEGASTGTASFAMFCESTLPTWLFTHALERHTARAQALLRMHVACWHVALRLRSGAQQRARAALRANMQSISAGRS